MRPRRVAILAGLVLALAATLPLASAHLDSPTGSATSYGLGGLADPDPCRRASEAGLGSGTGAGDLTGPMEDAGSPSCTPNTAVSGTYVGTLGMGGIECLGDSNSGTPSIGDVNDGGCDGFFFEPSGWGSTGKVLYDLEVVQDCTGPVDFDEPETDGSPGSCGGVHVQPEGTWDDGGIGGAGHRSTYASSAYNTADSCTGRQAAEDWLLGDDVPIVVGCDAGSSSYPLPCPAHVVLANFEPLDPGQMALDVAAGEVFCVKSTFDQSSGGFWDSCTPDSVIDSANLGKGDGHTGDGVRIPDDAVFMRADGTTETCTNGDPIVFVSPLVSANAFGEDVDDGDNPEDDGLDRDDFAWPLIGGGQLAQPDPTASGGGSGDTVVYMPVGGWIDGV